MADGEQTEEIAGGGSDEGSPKKRRAPARRANELEGAEWTRHSISVWSDIRKTPEETALKHPAMFPVMLVERVIRSFSREGSVVDPFCGSGSTLLAARNQGRHGIGFEVSPEYVELTRSRLTAAGATAGTDYDLYLESATAIPARVAPESVALCVTSPPYWDILSRKRTADYKDVRDYADGDGDLSRLDSYEGFLEGLATVFDGVYTVLRPGGYCVVNVMDLRKKAEFFPLHSDLAARMSDPRRGGRYRFDDLIIWDRRADYNNLRPLGYPAVFRINKVHEFLVILQKPSNSNSNSKQDARR